MTFTLALRSALRALLSNPLRSLLTMLGIIIGVGAVITMVAIGHGATQRVQQQMQVLGARLLLVQGSWASQAGVRLAAQTRQRLTEEDAEAIAAEIPEVALAVPGSWTMAQIVAGNLNWSAGVFGTTNGYFEARDWRLADGRLFDPGEIQGSAKVAILGQTVASELFGEEDPINQMVRVKGVPVIVVGLLERKGQNMEGKDQDDIVFLPISTFRNRVQGGAGNVKRIWSVHVKVHEGHDMVAAEEAIRALLRQRLRTPEGVNDPFTIRNLADVLRAQEASSRTMTQLLAAVAGISLLIGGIGIMNIMLVSVTERTREIGLRMAVGARSRDILAQFLIEAATLALAGGLVGVLLGAAAATMVARAAGWPVVLTPQSIALAAGFSALVGVFFGYYPARRAAGLLPIQALRFE